MKRITEPSEIERLFKNAELKGIEGNKKELTFIFKNGLRFKAFVTHDCLVALETYLKEDSDGEGNTERLDAKRKYKSRG